MVARDRVAAYHCRPVRQEQHLLVVGSGILQPDPVGIHVVDLDRVLEGQGVRARARDVAHQLAAVGEVAVVGAQVEAHGHIAVRATFDNVDRDRPAPGQLSLDLLVDPVGVPGGRRGRQRDPPDRRRAGGRDQDPRRPTIQVTAHPTGDPVARGAFQFAPGMRCFVGERAGLGLRPVGPAEMQSRRSVVIVERPDGRVSDLIDFEFTPVAFWPVLVAVYMPGMFAGHLGRVERRAHRHRHRVGLAAVDHELEDQGAHRAALRGRGEGGGRRVRPGKRHGRTADLGPFIDQSGVRSGRRRAGAVQRHLLRPHHRRVRPGVRRRRAEWPLDLVVRVARRGESAQRQAGIVRVRVAARQRRPARQEHHLVVGGRGGLYPDPVGVEIVDLDRVLEGQGVRSRARDVAHRPAAVGVVAVVGAQVEAQRHVGVRAAVVDRDRLAPGHLRPDRL